MVNKNTATGVCASLARGAGPGGGGSAAARPPIPIDGGGAAAPTALVDPVAAVASSGSSDRAGAEPRSEDDDERIALHEIGGHALVGRLLGCEVGGCTCEPGPGYAGLTWGAAHDRQARFSSQDAMSITAMVGPTMPGPGEKRDNVADVFMHVHNCVVELCAGSVAEALFLPGEPTPAYSDIAQERALASLICSSPESVESFVGFCMAEAAALLRPREHIVRALTDELRNRRTMTGVEIDEVIAQAISTKALADEHERRVDWQRRTASARAFLAAVTSSAAS